MNNLVSNNQTELFGLNIFMNEFIQLYKNNKLPNKILISGNKGIGKATMAYHFINYVLSEDEEFKYDAQNFKIDPKNRTFKTIINGSNPNLILIDVNSEKKFIDINQIRQLISNLNKSSFNTKPKFVLIDNIEYLNINSVNALLKILEEPPENVIFFLINNNKKILPTLLSRCINFRIYLSYKESLNILDKLLNSQLNELLSQDLINHYSTPGNILNLISFGIKNNYDLSKVDLKSFVKMIIKDNQYKKDNLVKLLLFNLIEFYFNKINMPLSSNINEKYNYFLKKIVEIKKFNLDEESLIIEFEDKILNG